MILKPLPCTQLANDPDPTPAASTQGLVAKVVSKPEPETNSVTMTRAMKMDRCEERLKKIASQKRGQAKA